MRDGKYATVLGVDVAVDVTWRSLKLVLVMSGWLLTIGHGIGGSSSILKLPDVLPELDRDLMLACLVRQRARQLSRRQDIRRSPNDKHAHSTLILVIDHLLNNTFELLKRDNDQARRKMRGALRWPQSIRELLRGREKNQGIALRSARQCQQQSGKRVQRREQVQNRSLRVS